MPAPVIDPSMRRDLLRLFGNWKRRLPSDE
jgi:hypothetical protein